MYQWFAGIPILPQIIGGHNVDNLPYDRRTRDLLQDGYKYHAFPWMVKLEGRCEGRGSMNIDIEWTCILTSINVCL